MLAVQAYLEQIITTSYYPITVSGDKPGFPNRWLVKSEPAMKLEEDTEPRIDTNARVVLANELSFLTREELENNWRYYIAEDQEGFYIDYDFARNYPETMFSRDQDCYIYSLCSIYCTRPRNIFFHVNAMVPIRIWINGQLAYSGSYQFYENPYYFFYPLNPGNNTLLVEKVQFAKYKAIHVLQEFFLIDITPRDFLKQSDARIFMDREFFDELESTYSIVPDRVFIGQDQVPSLMVLPKSFGKSMNEPIRITVANAAGEKVAVVDTLTSTKVKLHMAPEIQGTLLIRAQSLAGRRKQAELCVYRGDFNRNVNDLLSKADTRRDRNLEVMDSIRRLAAIPEPELGSIRGSNEVINLCLYKLILDKMYEFEKYLNTKDSSCPKDLFDVFPRNIMLFKGSDVDDGFIAYSIYLPEHYSPRRKYPLVCTMQFGFGTSKYPVVQHYSESGYFKDAIVLNLCGRGTYSMDFIHEIGLYRIIESVSSRLNVDGDRRYLVGGCTGTMRGYGLALRAPDLFAAVAGVTSTFRLDLNHPDYQILQNLSNNYVYQLCNVEDVYFNCARVMNTLNYLAKVKKWAFYGLSHIELDVLLNSKRLMTMLVKEKKPKYPRKIWFRAYEPIYNKSYWVQVESFADLSSTAEVQAEIDGGKKLIVNTHNIRRMVLLLNRRAMGLSRKIFLTVNGTEIGLDLNDFSRITLDMEGLPVKAKAVALPWKTFRVEYEMAPGTNDNLLGLKQVYITRCRILKPVYYLEQKKVFAKKLFQVLSQPIKERNRNYYYPIILENEKTPEILSDSNFVTVIDTRNTSNFQCSLLQRLSLAAGNQGWVFQNQSFSGEYFGLIKTVNPFDRNYFSLLIIYNSDVLEDELIRFLHCFDTDRLFYSDAVVYHEGKYHSFRNSNSEPQGKNNFESKIYKEEM
jgi:hypothetical protein